MSTLSGYCSVTGFGLGDLLKPDLVLPLLEALPIEERLAPYLPEVNLISILRTCFLFSGHCFISSMLQGQQSLHDLIDVLQCPPFRQQVDAFTYVRTLLFSTRTPVRVAPFPLNVRVLCIKVALITKFLIVGSENRPNRFGAVRY